MSFYRPIILIIILVAPLAIAQNRGLALARFDAYAKRQIEQDDMPGLTIGYVLGDEVWVKAYGYADLENQVAMKSESAFRLASVTKTMTAIGVLKLVEAGKIDLDAEVQTYVPDFPRKKWPVTVRQLLGHLGGISHYRDYNAEGHFKVPMNTVESLAVFQDFDLVAEPGTRYAYTSYGYNLLGAVIEGASGDSFGEYMQREIWAPSGMVATRMDNPEALIPNRVRGYQLDNAGQLINSEFVDISSRFAAGGTRSTVPDLLSYASAIMSGRLLGQATQQMMFTSMTTQAGENTDYGMGWSIRPVNGRLSVAHGGAQAETRTFLVLFPSDKFAMAVACNFEGGDRMPYLRGLFHAVLGEVWDPPMVADNAKDEALLDALVTCFQHGNAAFELLGPNQASKDEVRSAFSYLDKIVSAKDSDEAQVLVDQGRHPLADQALVTVGHIMAQYLAANRDDAWRDQVHANGPLAFFQDYHDLVKSHRDIPRSFRLPKRLGKILPDMLEGWNRAWNADVQAWVLGDKVPDEAALKALNEQMADIAIKPDVSVMFETEAQTLFNQGDVAAAVALLESCLKLYPNDDACRVQAAIAHLVLGDHDRARDYLERAYKLRPDRHAGPNRLNAYAYMLKGAGQLEAGSSLLKIAIDLHPEKANLYDSYAEFQLEAGNKEQAIRWYKNALKVDPELSSSKSALERILAE